jgi:hypothetical protein
VILGFENSPSLLIGGVLTLQVFDIYNRKSDLLKPNFFLKVGILWKMLYGQGAYDKGR